MSSSDYTRIITEICIQQVLYKLQYTLFVFLLHKLLLYPM